MEENILFSVIIPVYKVPYALLHRSIKSVIGQKYKNLDIIIVDDGSPDECPKICDEYASHDPRIRVIHQTNGGLSVVRNVGVKAAHGEWISFVDGDDWIEPDTYSEAARLIKEHGTEADVIAWDCIADFGDSPKRNYFFGKDCTKRLFLNKLDMIDTMMPRYHTASFRYAIFDVTWARVYRRSILIDNNVWNIPGLRRAQDLIFGLEVFEYSKGLYYENMPLYHYVLNPDAASRKFDKQIVSKMTDFCKALRSYVDKYHPKNSDFLQRMYVKIMPKIVECFSQYYIPYSEIVGVKTTIRIIRKELENPYFRAAVENMDGSGNTAKMKVFQWLLHHRMYFLLFYVCKLQTERKNKWMRK